MQEKMNRKCISARSFYAILNDGTISSKKWTEMVSFARFV